MKKVMMMAMMFVASATAFAGDSDALKAIKKAKTYAEAAQLLKSAQLANDEERADAYNKLVDLALDKVNKEIGTINENQAAAIQGKEVVAYDTLGLGDGICNAIDAAIECNKYDQMPNAKGKVKPQYAEKNAMRIWPIRQRLAELGDNFRVKNQFKEALKYWDPYLSSYNDALFEQQDHAPEKEVVEQVAYLAEYCAYQVADIEKVNKFAEIAKRNANYKDDALRMQLAAMQAGLKTKEDTLNYVNELKKLYEAEPENEVFIGNLFSIYDAMKDKAAQTALLDNHLAKFPNSYVALADKGLMAMSENNAEEGANWLRKAIAVNAENPIVQYYLGMCLNSQAGATDDTAKRKELFKEAITAFDKAKQLDPNKAQVNWGYNRYQAYYGLYGADDPKTKDAELDR